MAKAFYVYRILGERDETVYIGKGTGRRLSHQKRRFKADGEIIAEFVSEGAAYHHEKKLIALHNPPLNRCGGGGGGIFGKSSLAKNNEEAMFEMAARIIRTLKHYKQIRFFKVDLKTQLERFVQSLIDKYGSDIFAERLLPYNIKILIN